MKTSIPRGSNARRRRCHVRELLCLWFSLGGLKEKIRTRTTKAPMGMLMKKHQRHEAQSVRAPPISGPAIKATPHAAPTRPVSVTTLGCVFILSLEGDNHMQAFS